MIDYAKENHNFEYFCRDYGDVNLEKTSLNNYKNKQTQKMWTYWKARAKLAQAEINDLKQQIAELHASRASWVEYSQKVESGEFVLVPRNANDDMWESGWREFEISESMHKAYKAMIEASQQPTNLIDSFIADGGFDKAMGCKNGE